MILIIKSIVAAINYDYDQTSIWTSPQREHDPPRVSNCGCRLLRIGKQEIPYVVETNIKNEIVAI